MQEEIIDHIGRVKMISIVKGFGFISSDTDGKDYYFKLNSLHEAVKPNDEVAFLFKKVKEKEAAVAIRKLYTNQFGIKFIPRVNKKHIHDGVDPYLPMIYEQIIDISEFKIVKEYEFPSIIGSTICVATDSNDIIFYAIREGRLGHSRFVLHREPEKTNFITIVLLKISDLYKVMTCYLGRLATPEPWDKDASINALEFWSKHALISGYEEIITDSKTYYCPWDLNQPAICRLKCK